MLNIVCVSIRTSSDASPCGAAPKMRGRARSRIPPHPDTTPPAVRRPHESPVRIRTMCKFTNFYRFSAHVPAQNFSTKHEKTGPPATGKHEPSRRDSRRRAPLPYAAARTETAIGFTAATAPRPVRQGIHPDRPVYRPCRSDTLEQSASNTATIR